MRALVAIMVLSGCGGPRDTPKDATQQSDSPTDTPIDNKLVDALVCAAPLVGHVGGPCTTDAACDSAVGLGDGVCLHGAVPAAILIVWPRPGFA